jgi:hypothetical protein
LEKALLVEKKVKKAGARRRNECHTIATARGVLTLQAALSSCHRTRVVNSSKFSSKSNKSRTHARAIFDVLMSCVSHFLVGNPRWFHHHLASQRANAAVDIVRLCPIGGQHERFPASASHDHVVAALGKTRREFAVCKCSLIKKH